MEFKDFLKPVDVEGMIKSAAADFMLEVKAFLKAWGDPEDTQAGGTKKNYLELLKRVQDAEADLLGFTDKTMQDNVSGNLRDILSIIYGIGSPEVHAYDVCSGFDAKLNPADSGKGFKDDKRLAEWVGIGDGKMSGEILGPKAKGKRGVAVVTDEK